MGLNYKEDVKKTKGLIDMKDKKRDTIEDDYEVLDLIVQDDQTINRSEKTRDDGKKQNTFKRLWDLPWPHHTNTL